MVTGHGFGHEHCLIKQRRFAEERSGADLLDRVLVVGVSDFNRSAFDQAENFFAGNRLTRREWSSGQRINYFDRRLT